KLAKQVYFHNFAKHRRLHPPFIQFAAAEFAGLKAFKDHDHRQYDGNRHPPPMRENMAGGDQDAGRHRQFDVETIKDINELRHHEGHEKNHEQDAHTNDHHRIDHRGFEFRLD